MRTSAEKAAGLIIFCLLLLAVASNGARAEVEPGDVIDKSNYQKIEGLVPDFVLGWVKNGDLVMKIGKLNFDQKEFWPTAVKNNWASNIGRYKIDENNGIIDVKTGQPARDIKGIPFPDPDPNDPTIPVMLLWNRQFYEYFIQGPVRATYYWLSIARSGLEKSLLLDNLTTPMDPAKDDLDFAQLTVFHEPFNLSGVGTLAIYSLNPLKSGMRFSPCVTRSAGSRRDRIAGRDRCVNYKVFLSRRAKEQSGTDWGYPFILTPPCGPTRAV